MLLTFGHDAMEHELELLPSSDIDAANATRTILVIDDESAMRAVTRRMLAVHGFSVLEAESAAQALLISHDHASTIDLVLADVVLPGMKGPEVVTELLRTRPRMRFLYMSGHTAATLSEETLLPSNLPFLHKPFSRATLLEGVLQALAG